MGDSIKTGYAKCTSMRVCGAQKQTRVRMRVKTDKNGRTVGVVAWQSDVRFVHPAFRRRGLRGACHCQQSDHPLDGETEPSENARKPRAQDGSPHSRRRGARRVAQQARSYETCLIHSCIYWPGRAGDGMGPLPTSDGEEGSPPPRIHPELSFLVQIRSVNA